MRPGCFSSLGLAATGIFVIIIAAVTWLGGGILFSPGPLNAQAGTPAGGVTAHSSLAGNCLACHAAPWSAQSMADLCLGCHADVRAQIAGKNGIHGAWQSVGNCRSCHTEHRGAAANLTSADLTGFDHQQTGFALNQHTQAAGGKPFTCQACHPSGFRGPYDQAICRDCHAQLKPAFMAQHLAAYGDGCFGCHNGQDHLLQFDHSQTRFPLQGKHAGLKCQDCHTGQAKLGPLPTDCAACHSARDPHQGKLGQNCAQCHTAAGWQPANFDHATTKFPLTGGHLNVACERCHKDPLFVNTPSVCYACHAQDDRHKGQLGQDCAACHRVSAWQDVTFDHNKTAFPLTGKHSTVECATCHANGVYKGTATTCSGCHAKDDKHAGQFGQDCAACHKTSGWADVTFDHNKTAFPLTGKHTGVKCDACHVNGVFKGTPTVCESCHKQPASHVGVFGTTCADCHRTEGWSPANLANHPFPLNHGNEGANSPCATCHPNNVYKSYTCYGCHRHDAATEQARHANRGITDLTNCVKCHPNGRRAGGD